MSKKLRVAGFKGCEGFRVMRLWVTDIGALGFGFRVIRFGGLRRLNDLRGQGLGSTVLSLGYMV